ncbi:MAG: hypothetical protein J1G38_04650 [Clostridiales bacterium]|nr:hypothetical protein [Clostridiales bacterium]
MQKPVYKLAVFICNIVVAVMCVLSVVSYFFAPFWKIDVSVTVNAETLQNMIGDSLDFDAKEIVGKDGLTLDMSIKFETSVLFESYGDEGAAVEALVDDNVALLVDQLADKLSTLAKNTVRYVTTYIVTHEVHSGIKALLSSSNPDISDEEVSERLAKIGITDEYIAAKTGEIIDEIFGEGSTLLDVCEDVITVVGEIYEMLAASDDPDLHVAALTEEDKESIRQNVKDTLNVFASENGNIAADEIISNLLSGLMGDSSETNGDAEKAMAPYNANSSVTPEAKARLKTELRKFFLELIPEDAYTAIAWVMRGMTFLYFFSSAWWVYILIKLGVKLLTGISPAVKANPTVKLKTVIWLGWLPFLIFGLVPLFASGFLQGIIADALPAEMAAMKNSLSISFFSVGWVAGLFALICLGISIFYMIARKNLKESADSD